MSFPEHDSYWMETVHFLQHHAQGGEFIFAPDLFWEKWPHLYTYKLSQTATAIPANCHWALLHKGMLTELGEPFLQAIVRDFSPVFANAVFVIFTRNVAISPLSATDVHLIALQQQLRRTRPWLQPWAKLRQHWSTKLSQWFSPTVTQRTTGLLGNMSQIVHFTTLSDEQIRQEMNHLYREGGYEFPTLYDQTRLQEIDRYILDMIPPPAGLHILDIGCGTGRAASLIQDYGRMVGIDLSDVAIQQAQEQYGDLPNCQFLQMNALALDFANHTFDIVLSIEMVEHVSNTQQHLQEALRVLKPGGCFLVNVANRESLHLRITEALGYAPFRTNYQHFQEFSLAEFKAMIALAGGEVQAVRGSFLNPYWGVPGVSKEIRQLTDHHSSVVKILQDLGHQVAPEYTYAFFIACTKS